MDPTIDHASLLEAMVGTLTLRAPTNPLPLLVTECAQAFERGARRLAKETEKFFAGCFAIRVHERFIDFPNGVLYVRGIRAFVRRDRAALQHKFEPDEMTQHVANSPSGTGRECVVGIFAAGSKCPIDGRPGF